MGFTLHLKKNGIRYTRNAEELLYARAHDNSCILYFKNGETFYYGYSLKFLEKKLVCLRLFVRVHRSFLIKLCDILNYSYLSAKLSNGEKIPLGNYGYIVVKEYVDKKNSIPPSSVA